MFFIFVVWKRIQSPSGHTAHKQAANLGKNVKTAKKFLIFAKI